MARRELGAQIAHLASVAPDASDRLIDRLAHAFSPLDAGLADGPEVQRKDGRYVRRWLVSPLLLFDERDGREVIIRRVRHGAQRPITRH
ncbi:MAG TPA: type II toxin-antitoxin system RelE/ParE family toxin [Polyangiaceae bacterium]|nr:type II toxin-antitoxin system RelE/ParE family toxin [Polyangiaceae bacterium]